MPDLRFTIHGATTRRVRPERWTRRPRMPRVLIAVAGVVLLGTLTGGRAGRPAHVAIVNGVEVYGTRAVVLVDTSPSMSGTGPQVQAQLRALEAAGVHTGVRAFVNGSAITRDPTWDFVPRFTTLVADNPGVDLVYVVSDFRDFESNQPAAIDDFIAFIRRRRLRVYWATVNTDPQPPYYAIASVSGGGVIPPR